MAGADRTEESDLIVYADFVCPYCYLAEAAIRPLIEDGVRVDARAFELRPAPQPLPDMEARYFVEAWERSVLPLAQELGVRGMKRPRIAPRTRKAHEAALYARDRGVGDAMRLALYKAYFEHERDIGRVDVLVEVGTSIGLETAALKVALDVDKYTDAVLDMENEARLDRISGVPAMIKAGVDGRRRMMLGVRSTDELRTLLSAGVSTRSNGDDA